MKFQFKEGQWFDVRKLTDWQKQWCLENLDILPSSRDKFRDPEFPFWRYRKFKVTRGSCFGTTTEYCTPSDNEIIFNDFYWGEDDTEFLQESIFDNPRWVTFDESKDLMSCFIDTLVDGKDYTVVETKVLTGGDKTYLLGNGVRVHESYFHKVTPQDLLLDESTREVGDSFDNLEFVQPDVIGASVPLKNLSNEQLKFILDYFKLDFPQTHTTHFTCLPVVGYRYFSYPKDVSNPNYNLSFNNIFQEVK